MTQTDSQTRSIFRHAFTFIEVAVVIIIVGILAAIVVPRFGSVTDEARSAATQGVVGSVRASIAGFRTSRLLAGGAPFPTLAELTASGTVLEQAIPPNPFTGATAVQAVNVKEAAVRAVSNSEKFGWNYYVDNAATPPVSIFYSNCETSTTVVGPKGTTQKASEL